MFLLSQMETKSLILYMSDLMIFDPFDDSLQTTDM